MTVYVREATRADYAALSGLFEEIDRLHSEHLPEIFRARRGPTRSFGEIASLIEGHDSDILVAEVDGVMTGCAIVYTWQTRDRPLLEPLRYAMVDTIVVRSGYRRMGIGRRLMMHVELWAQERGMSRIELNVFEFNTDALAFYKALGYETLSRRLVKRLGDLEVSGSMATLPVVVRAATRRDLLQLEAAFPFGPPEKHAERLDRQDRDKVVYLIAWRGDQPVGHGLLKWDGASEGHIRAAFGGTCPDVEDLFVVEASRSQGIGTQILQAAEKLATYRGFSRLGLSVDLRNVAARALYERLGYRDAGLGPYAERGHFIGRDGRREYWEETCVYLVKSLDPTVNTRS